jgi:parallel beta-helix repeat protein
MNRIVLGMAMAAALAGCERQGPAPVAVDRDYQKVLIERLLDAKPGDVIEIPAGTFAFDRSLNLRADGVTIRGAGMDKTVLSFKGQKSGAEGLLVNAGDFTIENLAIEDSKGDGLKVNEGENIVIRGVRVEWTRGPHTDNGAYGLYPVQTKNVLIEDCVVIGASDAGLYVGQSDTIVVRRNRVERNVAGIEIENSKNADVHDNVATQNTGGILVFDMPNLPRRGTARACSRTGCSTTTPTTSRARARRWRACRPAPAWCSIPPTRWRSSITTSAATRPRT